MERTNLIPYLTFYPLIEMEKFNEQLIDKLMVKFHRLENTIPGIEHDFVTLCRKMNHLGIEERAIVLIKISEFYLTFMSNNNQNITQFKKKIDKRSKFGQLLFSYVDQFPEPFMDL